MVGGTYVNEIYGDNPEEIVFDKEGILSLDAIEKNFLTLMPLLENAKFTDIEKIHTNFISREFLAFINKEKENKL